MIQVNVKKQNENIIGFRVEGHSGYAPHGSDIICSAVSVLTINCINSIEELAEDEFLVDTDEERGLIDFTLQKGPSPEAELLLRSWELGIAQISESYGEQYVLLINR